MNSSDIAKIGEKNRRPSKPRMSLKDRRSFSSDMTIDLTSAKNSNIFSNDNTPTTTPNFRQTPFNGPVNTPYQLDSLNISNSNSNNNNTTTTTNNNNLCFSGSGNNSCNNSILNSSNADVIMESEEEQSDFFAPPFVRLPSSFGSPKRLSQMRESLNGMILSGETMNTANSEDNPQYSSPSVIKTEGSSSNTTPLATKFRFGNHSRSSSGNSNYQNNLENHKQYADNIKNSNVVIGRTTSLNSSLDMTNAQRAKSNTSTNKILCSNSNIITTSSSTLHKHSNSSGFEKTKMKRKHKHNFSLPQAHLMTISTTKSNSTDNGHRIFGENFFKINVQYQETLSPLLDSVNSEDLKRLNFVKKFHENQHEEEKDLCTENLQFYNCDNKEAFFQKHYKLFKEKLIEKQRHVKNITGNIPLVPEWLDYLLSSKEKLYFVGKFQQLSYLERERIDQYFLYQKNLFENNNKHSSSESENSELFSGDVFENGIKNRYKSVIPYQKTRVILQENAKSEFGNNSKNGNNNITTISHQENDTYFNGNYLSTPFKTNKLFSGVSPYIATQAPLEHTIRDFFNVLISNKVRMVLTLTKEIENGMNKCSNFWRDDMVYNGIRCDLVDEYRLNDEHMSDCLFKENKFGGCSDSKNTPILRKTTTNDSCINSYFQLPFGNRTSQTLTHDIEDSLIIRLLKLTWLDVNTGEPKEWVFMQVQMTSWPDFSVPNCNCDLLNVLVIKMIVQSITNVDSLTDGGSNIGKILVHCSSGSGRSGAICCTDSLIEMMLNGDNSINSDDPIYDIVASFREQRLHMVQNVNQYMMIYDCLVSFLQSQLDGSWNDFKNKCSNLSIFTKFEQMIQQ